MKSLLEMAALALSVIGTLFTNVDAPKAQASSHEPQATVAAAPSRSMPAATSGRAEGLDVQRGTAKMQALAVVFGEHDPLDEQLVLGIRLARSVKVPVADRAL